MSNGGPGIFLTTGAHIMHSQADSNGGHGIHILIGEVIASNATANGGDGIYVQYGSSLLVDNVIERNTGVGIRALGTDTSWNTGYARNAINRNNGAPQVVGALVNLGQNMCGGDTACP